MSYCVECGVKLAESEPICPLCQTPVINPRRTESAAELPLVFPPATPVSAADKRVRKNNILAIASAVYLLPVAIVALVDLSVSGAFTWSRFALCGLVLFYGYVFCPLWMKKHVIRRCVPLYGLLTLFGCWCTNYWTGGAWFIPFALPLTVVITSLTGMIFIIVRHSPWRVCANAAVAVISIGATTLYVDFLVAQSFFYGRPLTWSLYSAAFCAVLGAVLLILDRNPIVRQKLRRKFFV